MPPAASTRPPPTCVQPDHFYPTGAEVTKEPDPPGTLYDPQDDPLCQRGIPVFKPTMDEFNDFEAYMTRVDVWGRRSGIVKIIPPPEWSSSLPSTRSKLPSIVLKNPIEQRMEGTGGLYRQQNIERRKTMSLMDWARMCQKEGLQAPDPKHASRRNARRGESSSRRAESHSGDDDGHSDASSTTGPPTPPPPSLGIDVSQLTSEQVNFYNSFIPESSWLPPDTQASDYTPEACRELERTFWRNCGIVKPAWYGADMSGSLFSDETKTFNVASLPSFLSRLTQGRPIAGVNTPYLYFGMWRATFAWHVEDMDLYSINYIHWGAPKFWYAIPSERSKSFEGVMRNYFPSDKSQCPEFLRHKSYLASPSVLAQSSLRPNVLVQHQGEFVITYPRGYHAGFNLGLNCAESTNFALESWVDMGRTAGVCQCVPDSVSIDVDALLQEAAGPSLPEGASPTARTKRTLDDVGFDGTPDEVVVVKRMKTISKPGKASSSKPKPVPSSTSTSSTTTTTKTTVRKEKATAQCCLCNSQLQANAPAVKATGYAYDLLRCVGQPVPVGRSSGATQAVQTYWAHEICAKVVPETWVDEDSNTKEKLVYGLDCVVKERWQLKCNICSFRAGAKIQCVKGKCPKAFHVTCAIENPDVLFQITDTLDIDVVTIVDVSQLSSLVVGPTAVVPLSSGESQIVKKVKKYTFNCLCTQHNPSIIEARKKDKKDKLRQSLHALPPFAPIRVRATTGAFEVSLLSIDDGNQIVIVSWANGGHRSFKWDSILSTTVVENTRPVPNHLMIPAVPAPPQAQTAVHSPPVAAPSPSIPSPTVRPPIPPPYYTHPPPVPPAAPPSNYHYAAPYPPASLPYAPPRSAQPPPSAARSWNQRGVPYPSTSPYPPYPAPTPQMYRPFASLAPAPGPAPPISNEKNEKPKPTPGIAIADPNPSSPVVYNPLWRPPTSPAAGVPSGMVGPAPSPAVGAPADEAAS